jgi:protein-S-isoprenylcysteine O-methyltransferase Ste14
MIGIGLGIVVYVVLATFVLWLRRRGTDDGSVSFAAVIATWLTYLVHADTVVAAAFLDPWRIPVNEDAALVAGVMTGCVGLTAFVLSSRTLLSRAQISELRPRRLVTTGPYERCRHPQDQSWILLLLAVAIIGRSPLALVVVLIFFWFLTRLWQQEEQQLEGWFEEEWVAYRAQTPGFVVPGQGSLAGVVTHPDPR